MKTIFKRTSKLFAFGFVFIALIFIFSSCEDPLTETQHISSVSRQSFSAGPEGGTFYALNGNVTIEIPNGALLKNENFTINEVSKDNESDFVIKGIIIKPRNVIFELPARLRLRYDGQLSYGSDLNTAKSLVIYHFKSEAAFDKRYPSDMIWINKCHINKMDQCLETEINSGGIFAIGEKSLGHEVPEPF